MRHYSSNLGQSSRRGIAFFIVISSLLIVLAGCASPALKTGYLKDYTRLWKGEYLENYWENKALLNSKEYSKISVEAINIDRIKDEKGVTAEDCRRWLRNALLNATSSLRDNFIFDDTSSEAQARLEIAITEMTPGSAAGRIFAGELGMGHAWVQVEGRVVDRNGEEVVAFRDRRRSSGAIGFADTGGDAGPGLVAGMLTNIANDLVQELKRSFGF